MRGRLVLLLLPAVAACELTEVTVPLGEPRVVVHAVLSRGAAEQFVIVEEAQVGQGADTASFVVENAPLDPIRGAVVTLSYGAGSRCAPAVDLLRPAADTPGFYRANGLCTPDPGDVVSLRVETPDGRMVTGTTTMPGARSVRLAYGGDTLAPLLGSFNRDRDTLRVGVEPVIARAMQVEIRRRDSSPAGWPTPQDELVFYTVLDTLGLALPGDLINPFEGDSGEVVLRAGVTYDLTVAVTDTNYYDFARSFSDPLTGRGFINHLEGGLGVFGAVEAHSYGLRVVADVDEPREGVYRLQGSIGLPGLPVDVTLELYLDELGHGVFAAFAEGVWRGRVIQRSVEGTFGDDTEAPNRFDAYLEIPVPDGSPERWLLRGRRASPGEGFSVDVFGTAGGVEILGTVNAQQVSGPGT